MQFKLLIVFVDERKTKSLVDAARGAGATGVTMINHARGEGLLPKKTFLGLNLEEQRDILLFVVEAHRAKQILDTISNLAEFDDSPGTGIAFQLNIEDVVGVAHQIETIAGKS